MWGGHLGEAVRFVDDEPAQQPVRCHAPQVAAESLALDEALRSDVQHFQHAVVLAAVVAAVAMQRAVHGLGLAVVLRRRQVRSLDACEHTAGLGRKEGRKEGGSRLAAPMASSESTWSWMSEISGLKTTASPGAHHAGSWYTTDLPPPVGIRQNTSLRAGAGRVGWLWRVGWLGAQGGGLAHLPLRASSTHSRCPRRNPLCPNLRREVGLNKSDRPGRVRRSPALDLFQMVLQTSCHGRGAGAGVVTARRARRLVHPLEEVAAP